MRIQSDRRVDIRLRLLVLVGVMTDMHRCWTFLMPAVRRGRNPEGLQGQENQQKNGEPAAHVQRIVGCYGYPTATVGLRLFSRT
jgi:hypothetical protein